MQRHSDLVIKFSLLFSILLFVVVSLLHWESWWGFNHPVFIDGWLKFIFIGLLLSSLIFLFINKLNGISEKIINKFDKLTFGDNIIPLLVFVSLVFLLFLWFRMQTYFLGDGYTIITLFENSQSFIHKSTEYLSTLVIRLTQMLIGEYSTESSLLALKILSFFSGAVSVFMFALMIKRFFKSSNIRIISFITFIFSGTILLFFGYPEFYPLLWVTVAAYLYFSVRYLETRKGLYWVILFYILAIGMHIQAVYLGGGVIILILYKYFHSQSFVKLPGKIYTILTIVILSGAGFIIWKIINQMEFSGHFLPLFQGRPRTPGYAILSFDHLFDIANLALLIFPGIIFLIIITIFSKKNIKWKTDWKFLFLATSSIGSLLFLFVIVPYIGMARDWDLMSLTLLMPGLFLIYIISKVKNSLPPQSIIAYGLFCIIATTSFIFINVHNKSSEKRYYSLLTNDNDNRSRNGWLILANYYFGEGDNQRAKNIIIQMNHRFPQYVYLDKAYGLMRMGKLNEAKQIAQSLINQNPNNIRFIELMGNVYVEHGQFDNALDYFSRALKMNPYSISIRNNLGNLYLQMKDYNAAVEIYEKLRIMAPRQENIVESLASAYISLKEYKKAESLADSLFKLDTNSPAAHVMMLSTSSESGNPQKAKYHYREFIKYASNRPDYQNVIEYFKQYAE